MTVPKDPNELETIELELLLEGIYRYYGYDFRNYAIASLKRRIWGILQSEKVATISGLLEKVLHDPTCMDRFVVGLSVPVTAMFRDPSFFIAIQSKVIPLLRTYPFIRIWHAGCSTGEEVYSMAILLQEAGLYDRCRIYATDLNQSVLHKAQAGIYPLKLMQTYTHNYFQAGGKSAFSQYYTATADSAQIHPSLKTNIVFSLHNLATDQSFNEFHLILCRNVLIYFNPVLQARVHQLLYDSLIMFGILGLGHQENLNLTLQAASYDRLDSHEKLYQKMRLSPSTRS